MRTLAFYGKGGIGKSTISSGISTLLAKRGQRVLHVGCDPKADSTLTLVAPSARRTLMDVLFDLEDEDGLTTDMFVMKGRHGIDCIEVGGPAAGIGCSGQAMTRGFEALDDLQVCDPTRYDIGVFDVLGDVVCGGFAMPMRAAEHTTVVIVISEEMMACFAANNIAKACRRYADEGLSLGGLVLNTRTMDADLSPVYRFADALGAPVLMRMPRDAEVGRAELRRRSVIDQAPGSPFAQALEALADQLLGLDSRDNPLPTPMDAETVREVMCGPLDAWEEVG